MNRMKGFRAQALPWFGAAAVSVAGLLGNATTAEAGTLWLRWDPAQYEASPGGEFQVYDLDANGALPGTGDPQIAAMLTPANVGGAGTFQTFCIEYNEYLQNPSTGNQYLYSIETGASAGGVSGQTIAGFDPLDPRTAYLYTQFWNGTLGSFAPGPADDYLYGPLGAVRKSAAKSLQLAIWFLEGEIGAGSLDAKATLWVNEAQTMVTSGAWSGIGNVRVLHLTKMNGAPSQDQLVMVVPLPPSAALGLGLLGGLGLLRLRNRRERARL